MYEYMSVPQSHFLSSRLYINNIYSFAKLCYLKRVGRCDARYICIVIILIGFSMELRVNVKKRMRERIKELLKERRILRKKKKRVN